MTLVCEYCGAEAKNINQLRVHLRRCPVRTNGIKYVVGTREFVVKLRSVRQMRLIHSFYNQLPTMPRADQPAAFLGFLLGLKMAGKVVQFQVNDTGIRPAGQEPAPVNA